MLFRFLLVALLGSTATLALPVSKGTAIVFQDVPIEEKRDSNLIVLADVPIEEKRGTNLIVLADVPIADKRGENAIVLQDVEVDE
ncbi:hypothetical protein GGR54DRAFT_640668 [Hypoxylon sp. NC1633]|nr:hypothetical protein GGR54DRAFT_640668 [Hypoxylon sp. NC1633]